MLFENIKNLREEDFKRLTGVKRQTFNKMIEILKEAEILKKKKGGRSSKLLLEDRLLMTLEYLREYRTYYHIATSRGLNESTAIRIVSWIENTLIKSKEFSLPKKREFSDNNEIEAILVDVTETQIERPKRGQKKFIQEKNTR